MVNRIENDLADEIITHFIRLFRYDVESAVFLLRFYKIFTVLGESEKKIR